MRVNQHSDACAHFVLFWFSRHVHQFPSLVRCSSRIHFIIISRDSGDGFFNYLKNFIRKSSKTSSRVHQFLQKSIFVKMTVELIQVSSKVFSIFPFEPPCFSSKYSLVSENILWHISGDMPERMSGLIFEKYLNKSI